MAKRVFFAFHYQDVSDLRANVVRNHWVSKPDRKSAGYFDASLWESAKKQGADAVKRMINGALANTSVTCVLIGSQTYSRPWVKYEILKSFRRGNGILAVHINSIKGRNGLAKIKGPNPLRYVGVTYSEDGRTGTLWKKQNGKWSRYTGIRGNANFATNVPAPYRGKGFNLGGWYKAYDWITDKGYNNFAKWVDNA